MKKLAIVATTALTAAIFGLPAIAQEGFAGVDRDGDKLVTFQEASVAYPTLTQEVFAQADTNGDGAVDENEFVALSAALAALATPTPPAVAPEAPAGPPASAP